MDVKFDIKLHLSPSISYFIMMKFSQSNFTIQETILSIYHKNNFMIMKYSISEYKTKQKSHQQKLAAFCLSRFLNIFKL